MIEVVAKLTPKLLPLIIYVFMGFIAGRFIGVDRQAIAKLLIYILAPIVFFTAILEEQITLSSLTMPFLVCFLCSFICLFIYKTTSKFFKSPELNLLSFASGSANTGYFGIPATIILFGQDYLGTAILAIFGYNLFEYSVGFYVTARGNYSVKESFHRVLRLPALYAFFLAIILSFLGVKTPAILEATKAPLQGAYSFLGLSMIGFGISQAKWSDLDWKFIFTALWNKFIVWPALMGLVLYFDQMFLHFYTNKERLILGLMSIVPMAANGVSISTELNIKPEKIALAILISTILAIFYVPLFVAFFMKMN